MPILTTLFYFIITIFALVSVHEFGHFIAARIFGMHVPIYSIGMGRRLFGWNKLNGFTQGPLPEEIENQLGANTDYRLSLLPIGGYAKIAGMIDETQTEELAPEAQPWEFRSKSWWKKSIVISAGVIMNLVLAGAIFIGIKFSEGKELWETTTVGYVGKTSVSAKLGVQAGDRIVTINGKPITNWQELQEEAIIEQIDHPFTMTLIRNGQSVDIQYKRTDLGTEDPIKRFGLVPAGAGGTKLLAVVASTPADRIHLKAGDIITKVNEVPIESETSLIDNVSAHPNEQILLTWMRGGVEMCSNVTPDANGKIGVSPGPAPFAGKVKKIYYSLFESIPLGIGELGNQIRLYAKGLGLLFSGKVDVSKNLGGPIKIAQFAGRAAEGGASAFFGFMALLSLSLAFLNILPIPALDGGHLIIILIEAVRGRELSQKFKLGFQKVGVTVLLLLMAFMVYNDIKGL
ncbi:MAG: RIP metalloprotease RseP [bacterium]